MRAVGALAVLALAALVACGAPPAVSPPDAASPEEGCGLQTTWATGGGVAVAVPGGPRAVGAACAFGSQCASGLCSVDNAAAACGVCVERRRLGERCDGVLEGCAASATCDGKICVSRKKVEGAACALYRTVADQLECDDELFCDPGSPLRGNPTGVCAPRIAVGRPCGSFQACVRGATCREGTCVADDAEGLTCHDRPCPDESYCMPANDGLACQPGTLPLGARCEVFDGVAVPGECAPGSRCRIESIVTGDEVRPRGACVPTPRAGEDCVFGQCAAGFYCLAHQVSCSSEPLVERCEPLRALGESCETSSSPARDSLTQASTCAPGLECRQDRCQRPCQ